MVKCNTCGEELTDTNWSASWSSINRKQCKQCSAKYNSSSNPRNNPKRMYVDGKYISHKHPLYKPQDTRHLTMQRFSSLVNYVLSTEGEVYILKNPAWKNWYKIGKAIESTDRCNGYQTSSPHRDYELVTYKKFKHRGVQKRWHTLWLRV